jgi:hypothetical protein
MNKAVLIAFICAFSMLVSAQAKKPVAAKNPKSVATATTTAHDTLANKEIEPPIPKEFAVYTKRYKTKQPRLRLCINLVGGDSVLNYCIVDSLLRDPEKYKILFQQKDADSTYALLYVCAFTKDPERPECNPGRETKLFFIRWNPKTNKAIVKQKYIESCYRSITRLTDENLMDYDAQSPLKITYNKGDAFIELTFDPANYKLGIQSTKEGDSK